LLSAWVDLHLGASDTRDRRSINWTNRTFRWI
jgi:hypothetical protein